ncbi:MAG: Asp-tRNA(Asn)/Glu-tRNA(Gln) amidotransferase subunit GatA [Chloroflexi bacterium]|nr:Asp-tRNA(Asn)/Glu-tRNA(Gln) amidotransferase subunit GatA [Chloroflexota bacterium]
MTELTSLTISDALELMRAGDISARELTEAHLQRIEALDPALGAYLTVTDDLARQQAAAADAARAAGDERPLLGIPIALKDVLSTRGIETTCGSRILKGYEPIYDATVVTRLREAGAVLLGKLNMDEFAMGSSTENSAYFPTRNPWNLERVPGGSSGGSAAAVAANMALATLGTDTGGSIRQPASFCGVSAIKPSYGRVSRYGLIAYGSSFDQAGPFARTVEDLARTLGVIAGHDPLDSTSMPSAAPDYVAGLAGDVRGLRIGLPREYFAEGLQPEVETAVRAAAAHLESLGAEVRELSFEHADYCLPAYYIIAMAEASANLARYDGVRFGARVEGADLIDSYKKTRGAGFGEEVKRRIMLGTYTLSAGYYDAYYGKAQAARTLIRGDFDAMFAGVDALLAPVAPTTAFKFGEVTRDPMRMILADVLTISANLAGICGLSLPCGFDAGGLPIGMQLLGAPFTEERLLRLGAAFQRATDWHLRTPDLAHS